MSFTTPPLGLGPHFEGYFGVMSVIILAPSRVCLCVNLMPFHAIRITPHSLIGLFNLKSKAIKVGG